MNGPSLPRRVPSAGARLVAATAVAAGLATPAPLSAQGLAVRIAPEASAVRWKKEVGLDDATFLGGGLSLGFGRYVTLRGSYGTAGVLGTAFSASGYRPFDSSLQDNRVRTSLWSSGVVFRLGDRRIAPVLTAEGGVLDLEPEGRDRTRQILVGFGGGLDVRLTPWLDGQLAVESLRLRLDRSLLSPADALPAEDEERGVTRSALGLSASFGLRASNDHSSIQANEVDQGFGRLLAGSAEGLMLPLEAQVGVVRFDDALGLDDQPIVSLRTGLDLGPYFGVRGQLFQGVADGFDDLRGMWGWSGELQFNVGKVTGATPYLLVGAGQTRFNDEYRAETGSTLDDQNELIVGVGVGIPVDDRTRVTAALRDHVSTLDGMDHAASTSDLRHSLALSGGISVLLFGHRTSAPGPVGRASEPEDSADYRSGRLLAIPVPKEGEVYVRYGPGARTVPVGGAVDSAAVGAAVQEELIRTLGGGEATLSDSARAALQARVLQRLQALTVPAAADTGAAAPGAPGAQPTVGELRRQVDELTRLVREALLLQAAGGAGRTTVNLVPGAPAPVAAAAAPVAAEPFLRALDARLGRSSMGRESGGVALSVDAHVGTLRGQDNLVPFASLELARQGIATPVGKRLAEGSSSTVGLGFGATVVLPHLGPVWPTLDVLVAAARVGASADNPTDETTMDDRFGGLSLGPGIQLGAAYRPDPESRTFVTAALRKIWAGSTSRWTVQAGLRYVFPLVSGSRTGPFSLRRAGTPAPTVAADTVARPEARALADTAAVPVPSLAPADTLAGLVARLEALEGRLREEAAARERAEAEVRSLRLRADSLSTEVRGAQRPGVAPAPPTGAARLELIEALRAHAAAGSTFVTAVEEADGAVRVVLGGTLFPVGATDVAPTAAEGVRTLAAILADAKVAGISVEGHTDDTGTEAANLRISQLRAEAVRRLLVDGGVPAATVTAVGRGESQPVADNGNREGRARNRRVEIFVRPALDGR